MTFEDPRIKGGNHRNGVKFTSITSLPCNNRAAYGLCTFTLFDVYFHMTVIPSFSILTA